MYDFKKNDYNSDSSASKIVFHYTKNYNAVNVEKEIEEIIKKEEEEREREKAKEIEKQKELDGLDIGNDIIPEENVINNKNDVNEISNEKENETQINTENDPGFPLEIEVNILFLLKNIIK